MVWLDVGFSPTPRRMMARHSYVKRMLVSTHGALRVQRASNLVPIAAPPLCQQASCLANAPMLSAGRGQTMQPVEAAWRADFAGRAETLDSQVLDAAGKGI